MVNCQKELGLQRKKKGKPSFESIYSCVLEHNIPPRQKKRTAFSFLSQSSFSHFEINPTHSRNFKSVEFSEK
jgi:hypothetical protein